MNRVRASIRRGVVAGLTLWPAVVWPVLSIPALLLPAWAGDKAQTSGALRSDEVSGGRLQSEAERVGTMNKLLRNRQFDVFRAGNSLGGAIDVSLPAPSTAIPNLDPKAQQRLLDEYDRKKNWLAEPGSVKPREIEKADEIDSGKPSGDEEIPNFSRERGRSRRTRDESAQRSDFEGKEGQDTPRSRKDSKLASDDSRGERRPQNRAAQESSRRNEGTGPENQSKTISEILAPDADHKTWFSAPGSNPSGGTFSFNSPSSRPGSGSGNGFEGFSGAAPAGAVRNSASLATSSAPEILGNPTGGFDGDPGRRFDPTVAPGSPFSAATPDAGFFPKSGGGASTGGNDGGFGAFGGGAGARGGFEGSVRSLFTAPTGDSSSAIRSSPSFTPRPAVLSFPQNGPF